MNTYKSFSTKATPQKEPIPGKKMVQNSAGGYSFELDKWARLDRFLILGSEGGTYYIKEQKLTKENALNVIELVKEDGPRVVNRVVEVSDGGLAPKNDPALFVLAIAMGVGNYYTKLAVQAALPKVARIGTHLMHFASYMEQFRGWGSLATKAIADWYLSKSPENLAYQVVKYQQRDGWSNRDLLRLAHPKPTTKEHDSIFSWITQGKLKEVDIPIIVAFEKAKVATDKAEIVNLITDSGLTREMIPTQFLNEPEVWEALVQKMPINATVRNLGRMTSIGLIKPMSNTAKLVVDRITNQEALIKGRVHPLVLLNAMKVYDQGQGMRTKWNPAREVLDALDESFYLAFKSVTPSGKRLMLALDVSGSMGFGSIAGMALTPREASAALALVTANVESQYVVMGFDTNFRHLSISPRQRLTDAVRTVSSLTFGGTDCALPMIYADKQGMSIDGFYVYTDNETWAGRIHPSQALAEYRNKTGIDSKLIVVGMTSNGFSIADPSDPGMLDVVGFDTTVPDVMTNFVRGEG